MTAIEYGLIVALVAMGIVGAARIIGGWTAGTFTTIGNTLAPESPAAERRQDAERALRSVLSGDRQQK